MLAICWTWTATTSAVAAPYGTILPAATLPDADSEMGGAIAVGTENLGILQSGAAGMRGIELPGAPSAGVLFSAWARYGLTGRIEVVGGAWLPVNPLSVGLHGGARVRLLGEPDRDGPRMAIGATLGSLMLAPVETLAVTVPWSAGIRTGGVDAWLAPMATVTQRARVGIGLEGGVLLEVEGIPILVAAQGTDWGDAGTSVSGTVGMAFRSGM